MNDIGNDNVRHRTPATASKNGVDDIGNRAVDTTSKPAAKTILKYTKWSDIDICATTNKPCGVNGVSFDKLSAKDIRSIGMALKVPKSRSLRKRETINGIMTSYETRRGMYHGLDSLLASNQPSHKEIQSPDESRKRKGGYEAAMSELKTLANPSVKQQKMDILIREDARKEREEVRRVRAEEREEMNHTMNQFEKITNLLRKSREELNDTTLSPEDREDLLTTHRLLMNQKKKLQQTLFSNS